MLAVLSGPDATVLAAAIVGLPATIAAIASVRAARQATGANQQATAANKAVNDAGPDEPKIRDLAVEAVEIGRANRAELRRVHARLTGLNGKVDRHLDWHRDEAEQGPRVASALADDIDDDGGQQ